MEKEKCKLEALKYDKISTFRKNSPTAYKTICVNGWFNELCSHLSRKIKPNNYWTYNMCQKEALKYDKRVDFRTKSSGAYNSARINNWLNDICKHMKTYSNPRGFWTFEKCKEIALKYETKKDFMANDKIAYKMAHKRGWIDSITLHMEVLGNKYNRCIYAYEFPDNCAYIGLTLNISQRNSQRKLNNHDQVTKHINETGLIPKLIKLTKYLPVNEASNLEKFYIEKYKNDGWIVLNKIKGGGIGGGHLIWTFDNVLEIALKYDKITHFRKENKGAYSSAWKNNWLTVIKEKLNNKK